MSEESRPPDQNDEGRPRDRRTSTLGASGEGPSAESVPAEAETPAEDVASLQRRLRESEDQVATLRDRWQRASADLANLRKRTEQDREDVEKFASMMVVAELLPVLDNFERAIATIPGNLTLLTWVHGVLLIERQFQSVLERQGLEMIEAQGRAFDPHLHEAIAEQTSTESAPGTILQVYQPGYTMHGRMIRPALVEIAAASTSPPDSQSPAAEVEATDRSDADEIADASDTENIGP